MARKKGIKFNVKGFRALREDPNVQGDLLDRAHRIANSAGGEDKGYVVRDNLAREGRSGATVVSFRRTKDYDPATLIRNLSSGR